METVITDESIARQPPEAQAIIRALLAKIAKVEAKVEALLVAAEHIPNPYSSS